MIFKQEPTVCMRKKNWKTKTPQHYKVLRTFIDFLLRLLWSDIRLFAFLHSFINLNYLRPLRNLSMNVPFSERLQFFSWKGGNLKSLNLRDASLWLMQYIMPLSFVCSIILHPFALAWLAMPTLFSPTKTIDCFATGSQTAFQNHLGVKTLLLREITSPFESLALPPKREKNLRCTKDKSFYLGVVLLVLIEYAGSCHILWDFRKDRGSWGEWVQASEIIFTFIIFYCFKFSEGS